MEESLRDFRAGVIAQSIAEFGGRDLPEGFALVVGRLLEDAEELVDFAPSAFRGTGTRRRGLGIDGYAFDDADGSLRLVIVEFGGGDEPQTVTQTAAKSLFAKATAFVEEALEGNQDHLPLADSPAGDLALMIKTHANAITRLRFYLATDGILSDRIRDWPEQGIKDIPSEFHIWDIARLHTTQTSRSGREPLTVDFTTVVENGVPCLRASLNQSEYTGYLCVLPGDALAHMYEEYGSRLLEGNVRSFLGKTGKVNRAIRDTVLKNPEMFFAFNNGIAATATSVKMKETAEGPRLLSATDLQIVNGGQTTASLAFTRRKDGAELSRIFVQMKLSVIDAEKAGALIPKISEFSNKQNKVSDSDLFSNHEFHRRLEELSRRLRAPPRSGAQRPTTWFYERVKGQYRIETAKMSPAEKLRFEVENPRAQVITKTDLAKIECSWRKLPHEVSKGAQKNFDLFSKYVVNEWARQPLQFNEEYFRTIVAHAIVFRHLERLIPQEPWYDGGYRANVVAFSIAKLVQIVEEQGGGKAFDTQGTWKSQVVSSALTDQLRLIAKAMYSVITQPEEGLENVTEWCKKELAWQRAMQKRVELMPAFGEELVSHEAISEREADAVKVARIDVGIAAMTEVFSYKQANWKRLREWGLERREITPKEDQLLAVAATPGKLPSEKQAAAILLIRRKLEQAGFSLE